MHPGKIEKLHLIKLIYDKRVQEDILNNYLKQLKDFYLKEEDISADSGLFYGIYLQFSIKIGIFFLLIRPICLKLISRNMKIQMI